MSPSINRNKAYWSLSKLYYEARINQKTKSFQKSCFEDNQSSHKNTNQRASEFWRFFEPSQRRRVCLGTGDFRPTLTARVWGWELLIFGEFCPWKGEVCRWRMSESLQSLTESLSGGSSYFFCNSSYIFIKIQLRIWTRIVRSYVFFCFKVW